MTAGGHAPEQAMLHCAADGILIAADHLLPRIKPAIAAPVEEPDTDALQDQFDALDRIGQLPADTLVLPAHGEPFFGLQARLSELRRHHAGRLRALESGLGAGISAYRGLPLVFSREMPLSAARIPVAEVHALLRHLERQGRARSSIDSSGVRLFAAP